MACLLLVAGNGLLAAGCCKSSCFLLVAIRWLRAARRAHIKPVEVLSVCQVGLLSVIAQLAYLLVPCAQNLHGGTMEGLKVQLSNWAPLCGVR